MTGNWDGTSETLEAILNGSKLVKTDKSSFPGESLELDIADEADKAEIIREWDEHRIS